MSTRGCIARLTSKPGKEITFKGVYTHWDNYPAGTGATLFNVRNNHFNGDTKAMLKYLIDDCPQGWSTINDADFNLPPAPRPDDMTVICSICNEPIWTHYSQYYGESNKLWVEAGRPPCPPKVSGYCVKNHSPVPEDKPRGPECYPTQEKSSWVTQRNASGMGCEYVYAFTKDGKIMLVLSSFCKSGAKMIGMFGCGDPDAKWKVIGEIDLDNPNEPDWKSEPIKQKNAK